MAGPFVGVTVVGEVNPSAVQGPRIFVASCSMPCGQVNCRPDEFTENCSVVVGTEFPITVRLPEPVEKLEPDCELQLAGKLAGAAKDSERSVYLWASTVSKPVSTRR